MKSEGAADIRCSVLHLNTERSMRGGEVQTLGLIRELEVCGWPCCLVARDLGPLLERAWGEGFRVQPWKPMGEWDLVASFRLRKWIRASGARIVHAHTAHALALALMALRGVSPRPCLVASRRVSFPLRGGLSLRKYRAADTVVAVCEDVRGQLIRHGLDPDKVTAIHSGVDLARFESLPSRDSARAAMGLVEGTQAVGVVGALVPHKGHTILLRALARLVRQGRHLELLVAGGGSLTSALRREARTLGVSVRFLGTMRDPAPIYPALDVLAVPSLSGEGSPGVVKEAAAAGIPVVATDVGGTREILRRGREALIVPPGDIGALADALGQILANQGLARTMAEAARIRVREFTMSKMGKAHIALYRKLLGMESDSYKAGDHRQ